MWTWNGNKCMNSMLKLNKNGGKLKSRGRKFCTSILNKRFLRTNITETV